MVGTLKQVFSRAIYIALASAIATTVFALAMWLPNIALIKSILFYSDAALLSKAQFLFSFVHSLTSNFSLFSGVFIIVAAILFGMNIALLTYYIRTRQGAFYNGGSALSVGGMIASLFGIGCAACGTVILSTLFGVFGAAGLLALLPFGGEEFSVLGVVLLLWSVYWILKNIEKPLVCPVD